MGKKLRQYSSQKIPKSCEKKQQQQQGLHSLIKVLKPKVYITDSSTFKSLVQELTGNGINIANINERSLTISSSPPPPPPPLPTTLMVPVIEIDDDDDDHGGYQESSADDFSFDSSQVNNLIPTAFDYSPLQMIDDNGFQESSTSPDFSFDSSQVNSIVIPTSFHDYSHVQIGNNWFQESSSAAFSFDSSETNVATSFATFDYSPPSESCLANNNSTKEAGLSQYMEIESWLLEVDPLVYSYDCYVPTIIHQQQEVCVSDYDLSGGSHMIIL